MITSKGKWEVKIDLRAKDFTDMGNVAIELIESRTNAGKDDRSKPFKPYSAGYRVVKHNNKPDLHLSGQMFMSLTSKPKKYGVLVYFRDSFAKKKAGWNSAKRPFIGIYKGTKEYRMLKKVVADIIYRRYKA